MTLPLSKCSIFCISAGVFDPLGFLSFFVVKLKILFQLLCTNRNSWDEPLEGELLLKWQAILEFAALDQITVPMYYLKKCQKPIEVQLHGFSDASKDAYAAVIYVRSIYANGETERRLVASKTKIAPVK